MRGNGTAAISIIMMVTILAIMLAVVVGERNNLQWQLQQERALQCKEPGV